MVLAAWEVCTEANPTPGNFPRAPLGTNPGLSQDQGSQIHLGTISCLSQILIDDSVDRAEKFLLFFKAMLGEVMLLENVPIPSQLKFAVGFLWLLHLGSWVFGYLSGGVSLLFDFILLIKFSNDSSTAIAIVLRQCSIHLFHFHIFIEFLCCSTGPGCLSCNPS